jgi:thioesterase domain-containing protein/acyl carrier protein
VAKAKHEVSATRLREYLRQALPEYMVPAQYVFLPALPISRNGKIDKAALPNPSGVASAQAVAAPHDSVEAKLKSIWENVLGVAPVGTDQDFFELGGHSLLATKLLARVERTFGVKLPISSIFQFSTIAEFAPLVRNQLAMSQHAHPEKPPLIWVGGGTFLRPITKWLQPERNLVCTSLDPGEWESVEAPYSLENIAATLARRIRQDYPKGPYYLGGWCYEGLLAYETAQQLRQAGAEVGLLVLVDAATPASRSPFSMVGKILARVQREIFHLERLVHMPPSKWPAYFKERLDEFTQQIRRKNWQQSYGAGREDSSVGEEKWNRILHLAIIDYVPKPYSGPVLFFQAKDRPMGRYWDLAWEWMALTDNRCDCREIPGDHVTLLKPPNIDILAEHLKSALETASEKEKGSWQTAQMSRT